MHQLHFDEPPSAGTLGAECPGYAISRGEGAPFGPALSRFGSRGANSAMGREEWEVMRAGEAVNLLKKSDFFARKPLKKRERKYHNSINSQLRVPGFIAILPVAVMARNAMNGGRSAMTQGSALQKWLRFETMYCKTKELAVSSGDLAKTYVAETKRISHCCRDEGNTKKGDQFFASEA